MDDRERTTMDEGGLPPEDDSRARQEEAAAGAEAGGIGGPAPPTEGDEASRPVEEGGGGEAEGFEQAERELGEQASHGESRVDPAADAFPPEGEGDRSTASYAEPDEVDPTEVTSDPGEGPDDPGEGTPLAPDR
jgi:hypothetical protein